MLPCDIFQITSDDLVSRCVFIHSNVEQGVNIQYSEIGPLYKRLHVEHEHLEDLYVILYNNANLVSKTV
jgi:hypothetical protein